MKKIILTHSFLLKFDPKQFKSGQPYAPLGTLYAASMLRNKGYDFAFTDPTFWNDPGNFLEVLKKERPEIVIIYDDSFNYLTKMCLTNMREAAFRMTAMAKQVGSKVILCSPDAMDFYPDYLQAGADYCILGEGEVTLAELAEHLSKNSQKDPGDINGIAWKSAKGVQVSLPREVLSNLDELSFPAWDLLDIESYRKMWMQKNGNFSMNMVTTRGCPFKCIWCAKPVYGNNYSSRSASNVVKEMLYLKNTFHPDKIWFADDIFGLKPGWVYEFEKLTTARNVGLPYTIQTRADLLLENNQVDLLSKSGCKKAWLGVESGSQKILDAMHKGTTVDQIYKASSLLKKAGIEQAFFLQLGFPGEMQEDIRKTINLLTDLLPDDIGISVTYPLPGTLFYESVKKDFKEKTHWSDSDDLSLMFRSNFSPGYYKILHRYIHKFFRYRQGASFFHKMFSNRFRYSDIEIRRMLLFPYYFIFAVFYKMVLVRLKNAKR